MGSKTSTTTQSNNPYAPAQVPINQGLVKAIQTYRNGGFEINPYEGNMVADYDPLRQMADAASPGVAGGILNAAQDAFGTLGNAMSGDYQNARLDAAKQAVISDIMPGINASFGMDGRTGSGLHAQNLSEGLARGIAPIEYGAMQNAEQRALQAAGMVGGVGAGATGALDYLRGAGTDRQAHEQQVIAADVLRDQQQQSVEADALRDYMSIVTGVGSTFGVQSGRSTQSGGGLMGVLGLGLQAAPLFSDERLKTDIKRVGQTDDGLPIYTYRYVGSDTVQMGVIAQEVEQVRPQAVTEISGFKAVNYGAL